jgi:hypothetical protein
MIYYFVLILLAFFSLYHLCNLDRNQNRYIRLFSFLMFIVVGGLRYSVGTDWAQYANTFADINSIADIFKAREEKLFAVFMYISKKIINSYSFFILTFFSVAFYLKYIVFKRYSTDIFLSLIIYFFTLFLIYDLNGVRQGMALAFVFLSIPLILNKKLFLFSLIILIGCLFHISAIIFLPFYWMSRLKISRKSMILIIVISLIVSIPIRALIENNAYVQLFLAMDSFSHYSFYVTDDIAARDVSILSVAVFQRLFIFGLFVINYDKIEASDELKSLLLNGYFVSILLFVFLSFSADLAARSSFYYKSLEILMIPLIVTCQAKLTYRMLLFAIFVLFAAVGAYRILEIPNGGLIPYQFII